MPRLPNIVLTIADDQRHSMLSCCDGPTADAVHTPHLDALAARGCRFSHAYHCGSPHGAVCAPSRASLHSGRGAFDLPKGMGVAGPGGGYVGPPNAPLLGQLLRQTGYRSHLVGKWHNGEESLRRSFDRGCNIFTGGMDDHFKTPIQNYNGEEFKGAYLHGVHSTDGFTQAAMEFLHKHAAGQEKDQPFFLYVAFTAPHDPRTTHAQWHRMYNPDHLESPPNALGQHPFDFGVAGIRDELLTPVPRDNWQTRKEIADYYAMTRHMDHGVGRIHQTLRELGLEENTIVIHTADHGLAVGQHGLMGKQNLYDHSTRVPLIVAGPGVSSGSVASGLVYQHDLFPTLLESAGIDVPERVAYKSLCPLLRDSSAKLRDFTFSFYADTQRMVTDGRRKLIRYHVNGQVREQTFDLATDPWERLDPKTGEPLHPAKNADDLREALAAWQKERKDPLLS